MIFFSHTGERVSVHFSTRSSFLLDVGCSSPSSLSSSLRGSGSVSKWPVSGSGVPEERSQSVEDRHREENIIGEEISSTLSLERHQSN